MRAPRLLILASLSLPIACSEQVTHVRTGQVLLHIDTDAPLPTAPGDPRGVSTPLFDRLRVEIFPPGATVPCDGCTNEFEVDATMFSQKKVSFGVVPPLHVGGLRLRARLFKQAFTSAAGEPNVDSTLDVVAALPMVDSGAVVERQLVLSTENVGRPLGSLTAPVEPITAISSTSRVGTWSGAARVDCHGTAPPGAVCVPGGAYWMGHSNPPGWVPTAYAPVPRLVVLSPFFMQSIEVTVRQFRAAGLVPKTSWSGGTIGVTSSDWCTFTPGPGPNEDMPINCVTRDGAEAYCKSIGGDLPTEAEFEYVAGALVGDPYPWGRDDPSCSDAVFGRAGWGVLTGAGPCRPTTPPGGPSPAGAGKRDRVDLPGGSIVDLAGNMAEWVKDAWNRLDEPCWARAGVYADPVCQTPSSHDDTGALLRGGDWIQSGAALITYNRIAIQPDFATIQTGFRCVWPAK